MTFTADRISELSKPFERGEVHWRAQSVTHDGMKAMALAYIDARDVMERLDAVCGPANWEDSYHETEKGRLLCTIRINIDGVWISKSDGAGESDIEGEKGAISGAFKRAAVKWGIGRYLYDMPSPWVPCESYDRNNKKVWKKWTDDPWNFVRETPKANQGDRTIPADIQLLIEDIQNRETSEALKTLWGARGEDAAKGAHGAIVKDAFNKRKKAIEAMDRVTAGA